VNSNVTVDAGTVIRRYQERLTETNHTIILLEARLEALEAQLQEVVAHQHGEEAETSKPGEATKNGSGETPASLSALPESSV
jgi:hypothetical protein